MLWLGHASVEITPKVSKPVSSTYATALVPSFDFSVCTIKYILGRARRDDNGD